VAGRAGVIMCMLVALKIKQIEKDKARLSDGRVVQTAGVKNLKVGDHVNVYADVVVEKVEREE